MCLAVPGKITEINATPGALMGKVDFGGNYVIVHAGFALNTLSEEEAQETLSALREIDDFETDLTAGFDPAGM
jgi:hydrogenase expression/formation protein HypC